MRLIRCRANVRLRVMKRTVVRDQLDRSRSVINVLMHRLANLVGRVRIDVLKSPEMHLLGRIAVRLPTERPDDLPRTNHRRPHEPALIDRLPHRNVRIVAIVPNIAQRRESRVQRHLRVVEPARRAQPRTLLQKNGIHQRSARRARRNIQRDVRVRIHQPRHHPLIRQIDDLRIRRRRTRSHRNNFSILNNNDLIVRNRPRCWIDQVSSLDHDRLCAEKLCNSNESKQKKTSRFFHAVPPHRFTKSMILARGISRARSSPMWRHSEGPRFHPWAEEPHNKNCIRCPTFREPTGELRWGNTLRVLCALSGESSLTLTHTLNSHTPNPPSPKKFVPDHSLQTRVTFLESHNRRLPNGPMRRLHELDALRGLMLVWITFTHLPTAHSAYANQPLGFVSSSEGFIFLSALFT